MNELRTAAWKGLVGLKRLLGLFVLSIDRNAVAKTYLSGSGIEVGALHNPLAVPEQARVRYVDRMPVEELRRQYPELNDKPLVHVDIVDDGERLDTVQDASQDFVIANHFLEHAQDPVRAFLSMMRVLKSGGVLYLALPDKRFTFDASRQSTTVDHVMADYREGAGRSRATHYAEWAAKVSRLEGGAATAEAERLMAMDYSIHFHAWEQKDMLHLLLYLQTVQPFDLEMMLKNGEECIFILRKQDGEIQQ
jgi:SAM-dependent methyltransferase